MQIIIRELIQEDNNNEIWKFKLSFADSEKTITDIYYSNYYNTHELLYSQL